jgi:hypothetical protein
MASRPVAERWAHGDVRTSSRERRLCQSRADELDTRQTEQARLDATPSTPLEIPTARGCVLLGGDCDRGDGGVLDPDVARFLSTCESNLVLARTDGLLSYDGARETIRGANARV